jgi:hypothetical protein
MFTKLWKELTQKTTKRVNSCEQREQLPKPIYLSSRELIAIGYFAPQFCNCSEQQIFFSKIIQDHAG